MRASLFLGLAACWSSSKPTKVDAPAATASEGAKLEVETPKPPAYVLPKSVTDALASERLAGTVLVPAGLELQSTASAARSASKPVRGVPIAMQVVQDHGDVVELSTAATSDCIAGFDQPYELTVFVRRDRLMPRAKTDVVKVFPDSTGVAIDRGAPIAITDAGLAWQTRAFAQTKVMPREDQLVYSVPPRAGNAPSATLPALGRERLVCDRSGTGPKTLAQWQDDQKREQRARLREKRAEDERRRAEIEREHQARAERARKECERKARERKAKAKAKGPQSAREQAIEQARAVGLLGGTCGSVLDGTFGLGTGTADELEEALGGWHEPMSTHAPYCGVHDPSSYYDSSAKPPAAAPPKVNGYTLSWPDYDDLQNQYVVRRGTYYFADVSYRCGTVRMAVNDPAAVRYGGVGAGAIGGGGGQVQVWIPKPGPVTWPDGSPAGKYTGSKKYQHVVENGDRYCVKVSGVAETICHPKKTTTTAMSSRYGLD